MDAQGAARYRHSRPARCAAPCDRLSLGYVNGIGFALMPPGTVLAAPWGARIAHTINPGWRRWAFIVFLTAAAGRMLWRLVT